MKSYSLFSLAAFISVFFVGCNKDEDIISSEPDDSHFSVLQYKVVEYTPAPGQFINDPANGSDNLFTQQQACTYAQDRLSRSQYVSLGAWGGYIVVKFDESIQNSGGYDFYISGNSFDTSNEPGIVWVMQDTNGNLLPDDTWYELKGSYFGCSGYERDFNITYYRPGAKKNTPWIDKYRQEGEIPWLGNYHSQDFYYPDWITEDSYSLSGSVLPPKAFQDDTTGLWTNLPFEWGYADNFGTDFIQDGFKNQFKISDAITEDNLPANLSSIDFIKVQTGVLSNSGWLGELSTEVSGFYR